MFCPIKRHIFASLLVVLFAMGCGLRAREEQIPGTYVLHYPFGTETLIIAADHTFAQEVVVPGDNQTLRIRGNWSFQAETVRLVLDHAFVLGGIGGKLSPVYYEPTKTGLTLVVGKKIITREISLMYGADWSDGWNYKKVSSDTDLSRIPSENEKLIKADRRVRK